MKPFHGKHGGFRQFCCAAYCMPKIQTCPLRGFGQGSLAYAMLANLPETLPNRLPLERLFYIWRNCLPIHPHRQIFAFAGAAEILSFQETVLWAKIHLSERQRVWIFDHVLGRFSEA